MHAQAASSVACDFFTVESLFLRRSYALFFIVHGRRRVWLAGCTPNPTGAWLTQQARNLGLDFSDQHLSWRGRVMQWRCEPTTIASHACGKTRDRFRWFAAKGAADPAHIPPPFAIQATTHPALIPHEASGSSRKSPAIPARCGRKDQLTAGIPADPR